MMDRTDRHERYFLRSITSESLLYTEMIHANAVMHGNASDLLNYHTKEHPLAVQLGGSDPLLLSEASEICQLHGFKEINLNIGCPSNRVQQGKFGAVLMKEPKLVTKCVAQINKIITIPVTIKCRIGVDEMDENKGLYDFVNQVKDGGCNTFIIHARKAWLKGLSPKDNRSIPPLNYSRVYKLKEQFPDLRIVINGGLNSIQECLVHLSYVDGVMMGREAYQNPYVLKEVDRLIFKKNKDAKTRKQLLIDYLPYLEDQQKEGVRLNLVTRHLMGLFKGLKGAGEIRRVLSKIDKYEDPVQEYKKIIRGLIE